MTILKNFKNKKTSIIHNKHSKRNNQSSIRNQNGRKFHNKNARNDQQENKNRKMFLQKIKEKNKYRDDCCYELLLINYEK